VLAQDGGTPRLSATATVYISVERNLNTPIWQQQNYSRTVNEIQELGVTLFNLQALDADVQVGTHEFSLISGIKSDLLLFLGLGLFIIDTKKAKTILSSVQFCLEHYIFFQILKLMLINLTV